MSDYFLAQTEVLLGDHADEALRELVSERTRAGQLPEGVDTQLQFQFHNIVARMNQSRERLEAIAQRLASIPRGPIMNAVSSTPGGRLVHRILFRLTYRQSAELWARLRELSDTIEEVLWILLQSRDDVPVSANASELQHELKVLQARVDALERSHDGSN